MIRSHQAAHLLLEHDDLVRQVLHALLQVHVLRERLLDDALHALVDATNLVLGRRGRAQKVDDASDGGLPVAWKRVKKVRLVRGQRRRLPSVYATEAQERETNTEQPSSGSGSSNGNGNGNNGANGNNTTTHRLCPPCSRTG